MPRFDPFGGRALDSLTAHDLERLIKEDVREGQWVEYKSDWTSVKVARACASFANSEGGGTIVVGMEADQLLPTKVTGLEFNGEIETAAATAIRQLVDPVPDFEVASVVLPDGKVCLVTRIHPGADPPYVMSNGAILVRTPANSEPISARDRESIDRLFALGKRGEEWARQIRNGVLSGWLGSARTPDWFRVVTVPCAERGVGASGKIFKSDFVDRLSALQLTTHFQTPPYRATKIFPTEVVVSQTLSYEVSFSVSTQGVLTTFFQNGKNSQDGSRQPLVLSGVHGMLPHSCSIHAQVLEQLLGHRGKAVLGVVGGLFDLAESRMVDVQVQRDPLPIQAWSDPSFHADLLRSIQRHVDPAILDDE
jgi:hypothetical protein